MSDWEFFTKETDNGIYLSYFESPVHINFKYITIGEMEVNFHTSILVYGFGNTEDKSLQDAQKAARGVEEYLLNA